MRATRTMRIEAARRRLLRLAPLFALLALFSGCDSSPAPPAAERAADFALELFDGGRFDMGAQRGKVVVINFFASWCVSCGEESPMLERVSKTYQGKPVSFVMVAVEDTEAKAREFLAKKDVHIAAGLDRTGVIKTAYGIYGMPTTFFVDKVGKVSYMHAGAIGEQLLRAEVDKLL